MVTVALVVASLALGAVVATFLHRLAAELGRASVVECTVETRKWDPQRCRYVHRADPAEQLRTVLVGPPRRPPYVERPIRR